MDAQRPGNGLHSLTFPTRGRPQLSCTPCKKRKLKCDRARPCENCARRRESDSCIYPILPAVRDQAGSSKRTKKRLHRLESLVMGLLDNGTLPNVSLSPDYQGQAQSSILPDQSQAQEAVESNDHIEYKKSAGPKPSIPTSGSSSALWESVLQDIAEIRSYFEDHELDFREQEVKVESSRIPPADVSIFHSPEGECDMETLIASFPVRSVVDLLVANYFGVTSHVRPIIYPRKFLREYEKFWEKPYATSKIWIGLLFGIMRQGIRASIMAGVDLTPTIGDVNKLMTLFRTRTVQCLAASDYSKASMEHLDTLLVHLEAEFTSSPDSQVNIWILLGSVVRMAMRNGLHREPSLFSELSPFECEMRRRMWLTIVQTDILISWQVGMPSMIVKGQYDTMLPRNLREDDFDEDSTALPLSRPMNEITRISVFLVKTPLLNVFAKIAAHFQEIHPNDSDVAKLESELYAAREALPPYYKVHSLQESILDPPVMIWRRFSLDQMVHSGICILHRRWLPLARSNPQYCHSRKVCVDASLTLLEYQAINYNETGPSGRLAGYKWMATSVTKNDYLLAAMLLCLDLRLALSGTTHPASSDVSLWGRDRREQMIQALETSYHVWRESKDISIEAFRASEAVAVMLGKVNPRKTSEQETQPSDVTSSFARYFITPPEDNVEVPGHVAGEDFDPYNLTSTFSEMVSSPNDINWAEFDRYINNTSATNT